MNIKTGQTVYELVRSFDKNTNTPITPANFINTVYNDGNINSGVTINVSLTDSIQGIYTLSWSASTYGVYQIHVENTTTEVIYISEIYNAKPDSEINPTTTIYVGL
jgi:hypothetical protein